MNYDSVEDVVATYVARYAEHYRQFWSHPWPTRPINALLVDLQTVGIKATSMHVFRALNRLRQCGVLELTYQPPMYLLPFCDACHACGANLEAAHVTTLEVLGNAEVLIPRTM